MKLDDTYNRLVRELLMEERPYHRKADGTTNHEAAARKVAERISIEYPQFDDYQRSECTVHVLVTRSKNVENSARGTATAKGNGSSGITDDERSKDVRLFIHVEELGYVYMTEASVSQVKEEIARRREHIEADKIGLAELEWAVEVAGKLGAEDNDRMGDYVAFG